jgi:hypothetical protein
MKSSSPGGAGIIVVALPAIATSVILAVCFGEWLAAMAVVAGTVAGLRAARAILK